MSLTDDELRRQQHLRIWVGLLLMSLLLAFAFASARVVMGSATDVRGFATLLVLFAADMLVAMLVAFWMTRPLQERSRRKRLVLRQAMGTFPCAED